MNLSERQQHILQSVVEEYIEKAFPISSHLLEEEYDFEVSPATIRNEMQLLTEKGYLVQPHVSAGRIPTDKGYRFFADAVLREMTESSNVQESEYENPLSLLQHLRNHCSGLVMTYTFEERTFWKEGWEGLLEEPEFQDRGSIKNLIQFLKDVEEHIGKIKAQKRIDLYIGGENPFSRVRDFSMIFSVYSFPEKEDLPALHAQAWQAGGMIAIVGPKRMAYEKNITTLRSLLYGE